MSRCSFTSALFTTLLLLTGAMELPAQMVTYTWTGNGSNDNWYTDANWISSDTLNMAPPNQPAGADTSVVVFGDLPRTSIYVSSDVYANQLLFTGNTRPYFLDGELDGPSYLSATFLGSGGIDYTPAQPVRSVIFTDFELTASQTWHVASGTLVLQGNIYDGDSSYTFTKTGAGTLVLGYNDNEFYTSTVVHNDGRLVLTASDPNNNYRPLGSAELVIGPAIGGNNPVLVTADPDNTGGSVTLTNHVTLNGVLTTENQTELHFTGPVTLNLDTTINSKGAPLFIEGNIGESGGIRGLTVDSTGAVILTGYNSYTGGTAVTNGVLIFGSAYAIPSINLDSSTVGHLTAGANGYIGFGDNGYTNSVQSYFINDFDKANTHGTIGFDTDPNNGGFNVFGDSIDLSAGPTGTEFAADARLGSATQAILTGTITPQGGASAPYRFGGGGGLLIVSSQLNDTGRALVVDSPVGSPLTLGLGAIDTELGQPLLHPGNAFDGGVSAHYSAVIFGPGAMPATGNFILQDGGYIGTGNTDSDYLIQSTSVTDFLAHFPTSTDRGMIGFDYFGSNSNAVVTGDIDLSAFTSGSIYLGTATKAQLAGTITPQGNTYRFAAYKAGELEVASHLTGARNVIIGDPNSPATFGDYLTQEYATVHLSGDNDYTGGTTLWGGLLVLENANALGTGTLEVKAFPFPAAVTEMFVKETPLPRLESGAGGSDLNLPNNILLTGSLSVGGGNALTFQGVVSGAGGLHVGEDGGGELTLSGNNTFSGGIYLENGATLNVDHDNATGTGPLSFGNGSNSYVYFDTAAPMVHGLASVLSTDFAELYFEQSGTVLTIDQGFDSTFNGEFRSDVYPDDSYRIVKTGAGSLRLDNGGLYGYSGTIENSLPGSPLISVQVNQGTLVLGHNLYIEDSSRIFWAHGGTLALDNRYLGNPVIVDNGGKIAGNGTFDSSVTIGAGATVAPGLASQGGIGSLTIAELYAAKGGTYEWNLQGSPDAQTAAHDMIQVSGFATLDFSNIDVVNDPADSAHRFTLRAISLQADGTPGLAGGFAPGQSYSWNIFSYNNLAGFDPAAILIDPSLFTTNLGMGFAIGTYTVADTGGFIALNLTTFAAIPEPSTSALLALGLGFAGLTAWRRSRHRA